MTPHSNDRSFVFPLLPAHMEEEAGGDEKEKVDKEEGYSKLE